MALDAYVMPLWRFKSGFFETAMQSKLTPLGVPVQVVTTGATRSPRYRWKRLLAFKARCSTRHLARMVSTATDREVRWRDDGPVVYCEQFHWGITPLRAYAKWLDYQDFIPDWNADPAKPFEEHPVFKSSLPDRSPSFPLIVRGDFWYGYFLPCDFDTLVPVEKMLLGGWCEQWRLAGSSVALRAELMRLNETLRVPTGPEWKSQPRPGDPWFAPRYVWDQLTIMSELSCTHGLPIIFCS